MRRGIALGLFALVLVIGSMLAFTSPPRLLSLYDRVAGGREGSFPAAEGVPFGSHGQALDIWAPNDMAKAPLPVVIFWYGGGWAKGDRASYAFAGRALARAGSQTRIKRPRTACGVLAISGSSLKSAKL